MVYSPYVIRPSDYVSLLICCKSVSSVWNVTYANRYRQILLTNKTKCMIEASLL